MVCRSIWVSSPQDMGLSPHRIWVLLTQDMGLFLVAHGGGGDSQYLYREIGSPGNPCVCKLGVYGGAAGYKISIKENK